MKERFASWVEQLVWIGSGEPGLIRSAALSVVVDVAEGQVDPTDDRYRDLPLVAPNHIQSGTGRVVGVESAAEQGAVSGKYLSKAGDVVYSKIRPSLRKACIATTRCLTSADMYPLRPHAELLPEFLLYLLLSDRFTDFAALESDRVAMPKINRDALGRIRIPVPPLADQHEVVSTLNSVRQRTEQISDLLERQIGLLVEHRQALITAAVTGELSVPGVAA